MRAFKFWDGDPKRLDWRAKVLRPFGAFYALATAIRVSKPACVHCGVPVICIGNLNAGGTGKTPTTIALIERLMARGWTPHVVSRGYAGQLAGPVTVLPDQHTAAQVGDEPLLLAAFTPVHVARDRGLGAALAEQAGADIILLDDGFQNPSVHKDLSIVVVDAQKKFGNGLCLPAGPLREPVSAGLARADLIVALGTDEDQEQFRQMWGHALVRQSVGTLMAEPLPLLTGELCPLETGIDWQGAKVMAFAGIGHPEKFFATLRAVGAEIVQQEALQDHQLLTPQLVTRLAKQAQTLGAQLVTTEKDAVRLPKHFRTQILTLPVRLKFTDWSAFDAALSQTNRDFCRD
ncbi:MAG: tetraacyldisaccharide 4'-kinase [Paracoccaceae bacterium]|nr:tetraacyldisaccharide 4'-kinase [Paracoccaceae bacterium]